MKYRLLGKSGLRVPLTERAASGPFRCQRAISVDQTIRFKDVSYFVVSSFGVLGICLAGGFHTISAFATGENTACSSIR
jgi:hypothetical protein